MSHKTAVVFASIFALGLFIGLIFVRTSSAAPDYAVVATRHEPSGLTEHGIENARKAGLPGHLVVMAPQSNLKLLARATKVGLHAADSTIKLTVVLRLRNEARLKSFLEQVQNPHSAVYHQWLTPAEFTKLYGPTRADVARVTAFLKARGIEVLNVSSNRMLIHTEATTVAYTHALGIMINDYKLNGWRFYSTTDRPKLPRAIASRVVNILGLNHGTRMRPHSYWRPLMSAHGVNALQAPPASLTNLNPLQIAHAYNYPDITDAGNGAGVNVAILTAVSSGLAGLSDPHDFWTVFGLPDHTINVIPVDGDNGDASGMGETLLDVEYSGAMGPGITQNVYVAADASLATFTDMYNRFANDTNPDGSAKNQVMTTSWGFPETGGLDTATADDQIFMQAAAEGISMFAAAGDNGASDGTFQNNVANYPSSSPYITAANGTQLTISDLAGDYGSEVVWNDATCFGNGPGATGGAVSLLFDKPDWQTGPGVPANVNTRMNSDMAATASCTKPMLVLNGGQWYITAGTSAVAPQFAGMFAIAVAMNDGGALGQSNELIYNDVNAGNEASDFRDVKVGCNGKLPDGTDSCAGANWDHPTGWGSPNVQNLLAHIGIQGPKGTLKGSVADAGSGSPVAGAKLVISASDGARFRATTDDDGVYSHVLPVGDFTVTVTDFGYAKGTAAVSITDGGAVTKNFNLVPAPTATLSGKVSDGSGHGYGLYAEIKVSVDGFGQVADAWSDPATGKYSIKLPKDFDYTLKVAAAFAGYNTGSATISLDGNKNRNFALTVTDTCTAPGYLFGGAGGLGEDFNGATFPPDGWTVNQTPADGVRWILSSDESSPFNFNENYTGGTGTAADADGYQYYYGQHHGAFSTSLVTPPIPASIGLVLKYKANFQKLSGDEALDLDISTGDSGTWTNISHWTANHGTVYTPGAGVNVRMDLTSYLPSSGDYRLRWRFHMTGTEVPFYAQVDDVVIGSCAPVAGGLIYGQVTSFNSGTGLVGARVMDDKGEITKTIANPADSNLPIGTYLFFVSTGDRSLIARAGGGYSDASANVTVGNNQVLRQDFALKAPRFEARPGSLTVHAKAGGSATASFALSNTGSAAGQFRVLPTNAPPPPTGAEAVPVRRVSIKHPQWLNKSLFWIHAHANPDRAGAPYALQSMASSGLVPHDSPWVDLADYPFRAAESVAAFDGDTGKLYVAAGVASIGGRITLPTSAFMYDPATDGWSPIADLPMGSEAPVGKFINGKLYVVGGAGVLKPIVALNIYDPTTNKWSTGASIPAPLYGAAGVVLDGKLYVIGGVNDVNGSEVSSVYVYDPAFNAWSTAADYPHAVSFEGCGTIGEKIYCAGGFKDSGGAFSDGYAYDPSSDSWAPIADISVPDLSGGVGGALYGVANGQLLLAGGFTSDSTGADAQATNQVEAYDPRIDSWSALPNTNEPVARGGGSCGGDGFYTVGSILRIAGLTTILSNSAQRLPGYLCSGAGIPWLTVAPAMGTLASGASSRVTLTFDGSNHKKFTMTRRYLKIGGGPDPAIVPLTVHWDPYPVSLELAGDSNPPSVHKGDSFTYSLTVKNAKSERHETATQTKLTYKLPESVSYVASSGDAICTALPASSSPAPEAATGGQSDVVTCDFGTLVEGASKTVTIAVKAEHAGTLKSHFKVTAREPNDSEENTLGLTTIVIGNADVGIPSVSDASVSEGGAGTVHMMVTNAGPDTATDVTFDIFVQGGIKLQGAATEQGSCAAAGNNAFSCSFGDVASGAKVELILSVFGISAGAATVRGQVMTSADDPNQRNNVATAAVTVETPAIGGDSSTDGGGGSLGWLALVVLLGLAAGAAATRGKRKRP